MSNVHGVSIKLNTSIEIVLLLKNDENDQNAYVNIFQRTIDMIVIVFLGCSIPLGPLLTQISWL